MNEGHLRVGQALYLTQQALEPFVEEHMLAKHGADWRLKASRAGGRLDNLSGLDGYALLKTIVDQWREVFADVFKERSARNVAGAALDLRNRHVHADKPFDDFQVLDGLSDLANLLALISAPAEYAAVRQLWDEQRQRGNTVLASARRGARVEEKSKQPAAGRQKQPLPPPIPVVEPNLDISTVVELLGENGFSRVYFGPAFLTRNSLRGAGTSESIDALAGTGIQLLREGAAVLARRLQGTPTCSVDGGELQIGVSTEIPVGKHVLKVGEITLQMTVDQYPTKTSCEGG